MKILPFLGYLGAAVGYVSGVLTILGWSLRDVVWFQKFWRRIRLPYWIHRYVLLKGGNVSQLRLFAANQDLHPQVDRFLYEIYGEYRQLGVAKSLAQTLGIETKFERKTLSTTASYQNLLLTVAQKYLPEPEYFEVYKILKLWSACYEEDTDSKILEIIQVSCLTSFGYELPLSTKKPLIIFIQDFFLTKYLRQGGFHQKRLRDMQRVLKYLIPPENFRAYEQDFSDIMNDFKIVDVSSQVVFIAQYIAALTETIEVNL